MKLKIEIRMDNEAFADYPCAEAARILRDLAKWMDDGHSEPKKFHGASLRDENGNTVGRVEVTR